jgi:hypothetical protein
MKDTVKVRITANARFPMATRVELIYKDGRLDLTEEGVVQWPIATEVTEDGVFAIIKLPLENFTLVD